MLIFSRKLFLVHLSRRLKCTIVIMRCPSSVVRPSVRRPSVVVNFSHFQLLLWNHWTEFDETLQEGKISTSSTKFVFFGPIRKTRWPPWPLIGWDIFDFSSETAERNSTKLDRQVDLNVLYQVCVFRADRKNKMAALASDWLRHFRLLLWNRWTEFNETWQEARSQRPLPSLCFSGRSEKQDGRPGLWLAETFSTSPLKPLNGIQRNLTGSKISTSSTKFVFFGPIGKTRWPPWPLIGWDIFDFSSETAERNSTKLDRKEDLNVLYQVCVFWADRKNKMAALASDWLRHFRLLLWNRWTEFNETWQEARSQRPLPSYCFSGRSKKNNKMAALAPDWLRHNFRLLLWNRWTEFNETWQEARSQRPLPSLCFSGRSEKQDGRPGLWLAETFSTSPLKPLHGIQRNFTGSKISTSSTKFVFFGLIGKTRWPPWPIRQKGGTLYSGARYVALWASCKRNFEHIFMKPQLVQKWTGIQRFPYHFYAPGLKGPPGASSVWIVCPSVRPSVCPSVRNSVPLINKVQYLKFGWSYSNQTWTVSSSKGCSHFTDITCPWGLGQGQNLGLRDFCHSLTLLPPGASVFHKHMSSWS